MASKIIVEGFKSIGDRVKVEIRPLTLLAGANSSGKSSLMQAILLIKQTLEASFDPGVLLLNGPNAKFTSIDQVLYVGGKRSEHFSVGLELENNSAWECWFSRAELSGDVTLRQCRIRSADGVYRDLWERMSEKKLMELFVELVKPLISDGLVGPGLLVAKVVRERCMLTLLADSGYGVNRGKEYQIPILKAETSAVRNAIHVPGLRGNPARSYPLAASGPSFSGTFENYTASVIARWMKDDKAKVAKLGEQLKLLGLTWKVEAKKLDDANVELRVGRMPRLVRGGARDLVNIADVGFGVSQTLPVVVALIEAKPGQLVFIEQPEIHLHPRAQVAMAGLLADAAKRGVQLVVETHSSLLLLAVQTLVAEDKLPPDLVKLHWFTRDGKSGVTKITSSDLDEAGRFGDWPEDFDDVSLMAQSHYLDAVEAAVAKE